MQNSPIVETLPTDLLYGLDDKPPLRRSIFVALQHVLAVFVGIVTPPVLIARALRLPAQDAAFLVSMSLFISGLGTFLQTSRIGPIGSGLLSIQGTSFVFLGPIIALATAVTKQGGSQSQAMGAVFGLCLAASIVPMLVGPFLRLAGKAITPLVTGTVVTLIGLTLIQVGITSAGGGFEAKQSGAFGSPFNLAIAALVALLILFFNSSRAPWMRMSSVVAGLAAGYLIAIVFGKVDFSLLHQLKWFELPTPFHYGLGFRWTSVPPFCFLYLITAIESIGDLTATAMLSGQSLTGETYFRRLRGGLLADGLTSMLAAIFNSFPSTTFAQNNGVIQLTGVGSRYIGRLVGVALILFGLFPWIGGVVQAMPPAVLGGATLILFGTVAVAGIKILAQSHLDRRASTIAALSLSLGLWSNLRS